MLHIALCDNKTAIEGVGTTLFYVRGRNLATELSLWPGSRVEQFASGSSSRGQFTLF